MSPRPYRLGQRQVSVDETRARIVAAARDLLMTPSGIRGFTIDAVAKKAGVARMTVYYQFESKTGLLEALFDSLAAAGRMEGLAAAFTTSEPRRAVEEAVSAFGRFWSTDRLVFRRIRSLSVLDADLAEVLRSREERRRTAMRVLVGRVADTYGSPAPEAQDDVVDMLHALTSFEMFDILAGPDRDVVDVTSSVTRLARAALGADGFLQT